MLHVVSPDRFGTFERATPNDATPTPLPALDGLRGLAILLVIALHFVGQYAADGHGSIIARIARTGWVGVDLVLSGFAITGILLEERGRANYYRAFYWRRMLRILPAFALLMPRVDASVARFPARERRRCSAIHGVSVLVLDFYDELARVSDWRGSHLVTGYLWSLAVEAILSCVANDFVAVVAPKRLRAVV